jgi:flagellar assembly factor FliW
MTMAALLESPAVRPMTIQSDILGPLEVGPEDRIDFPQGLIGFPACHRFVLVRAERDGLFWLQSAEHGSLTFLLVDPFLFFPGYEVEVPPPDLAELGAGEEGDVAVLAIVTLPRGPGELPTANLQGPLVLNLRTRRAKQVALGEEGPFGVRSPFEIPRSAPAG